MLINVGILGFHFQENGPSIHHPLSLSLSTFHISFHEEGEEKGSD